MGKAATRRRIRRQKFLTRLSQENPQRFESEWSKRIDSWLSDIWQSAADSITLSEEEYQDFVRRYPAAQCLDILLSRNSEGDYVLYLHRLQEIHLDAMGESAIKDLIANVSQGSLRGERIFSIVDHASETLADCGEKAMKLQLRETTDLLSNECCRALAPYTSDKLRRVNIYRINQRWKPKE